jgi:DNA ligase D
MAADRITVHVGGHDVEVSSPDKVYFPKGAETKLDLIEYYRAIEAPLLRAVGGRPTLMQRFPNGVGGNSFFQKRVPENIPEWLNTTTVATPNGTTSRALVLDDLAHVVWAVNIGCLGFHTWPYLASDPSHTDELRVDLDPQEGIGFDAIREAALEVKAALDEVGLAAYPKTTGSRGLHIYARLEPRWDSYDVRAAVVALAREMERRRPDLLTAAWWKEERGRRVFVDFNQNAPHKTVFAPWSARSRVGGQASTPLSWDEVADVEPDDLTITSVPDRVARRGDPWAPMHEAPQSIEGLLEWSVRDRAAGLTDAPWPPVYPKMPGEPPRVAPSRARKGE